MAEVTVDLESTLEAVYIYFNGDRNQVERWLNSPHPELRDLTPLSLIKQGEVGGLVPVIREMLAEIDRR